MINFLKKLKRSLSSYDPLVEVLVYKDNIIHNLKTYQNLEPKVQMAPVLKSNAYGHGLVETGKIIDDLDIPFIVVDSLYEAMVLRQAGVKSEILIIGYTKLHNINKSATNNTAFTITSFEQLKIISRELKSQRKFHLKIDTGMHRQGITLDQINEAMRLIKINKHIQLEGICSHLADAESLETAATENQITSWNETVALFQNEFANLKYFHLSNTAGNSYSQKIKANAARLGIGLYGYNPDPKISPPLKPALAMKTIITSVREVLAGEKVGYNFTFELKKLSRLATVPVGYFEGVNRSLSSKGIFFVKNQLCPIVGRVSMNITSIDVTDVANAQVEDEVEIISNDSARPNSVENIARLCGTIPYEILVHIPAHLRRRVV